MTANHINQRIEAMCQHGCQAVRSYIQAMESGLSLTQLEDITPQQRIQILDELKAIMAVYDRPNRCS